MYLRIDIILINNIDNDDDRLSKKRNINKIIYQFKI